MIRKMREMLPEEVEGWKMLFDMPMPQYWVDMYNKHRKEKNMEDQELRIKCLELAQKYFPITSIADWFDTSQMIYDFVRGTKDNIISDLKKILKDRDKD